MNGNFDPYDMDREEFNPDLCMLRITEDCSLQQILSRKNNLDVEIKGITAGIQNLLYDNCAKFITASEVISKIKDDFEKMDGDMHSLQDKMSSVENFSSQIAESLQRTADRKQKLIKSRESVAKLALLVNLIPNLKKFIEQGCFTAAARHYMKAKSLLTRHRNLESLKEIIAESKDITVCIREKLRYKLDCCVYGKEEISEIMNLILDLGETESEILQNFLLISKDNLNSVIQRIREICFGDANAWGHTVTEESKVDSCSEYICSHLDMLSKVVEIVQGVFSAKSTTLDWSSVLIDFVEDHSQKLYLLAGSAFKSNFSGVNDECLANSLDRLYRKSCECSSHVPEMATSEKSADLILSICGDRCGHHLHRMKQDFRACLQSLEAKLKSEQHTLDEWIPWMNAVVWDIFAGTLHSLCHFISPEHKYSRNAYFRKRFCKLLAREKVFVPFLQDMNDRVLAAASRADALKMSTLLAKYLLQLHQSKAMNFLNLVDERLHSSTENLDLTSALDIANRYKETAECIINCYVEMRQRGMSDMFRHSMENKNWMKTREPRKVSAVVRRVLEDFYAAVKETEVLAECTESPVRDRSSDSVKSACLSSLSRTSSPENSAADARIIIRLHKLFSKPSSKTQAVEFSSNYILNRIVKMTLKSLLEHIRLRTFNRFGLQQLQVDVHCLELHVSQHMRNERDIDALFDDIMSSCYGRAIHPEFMNPHVVSSLSQSDITLENFTGSATTKRREL